MTDQVEPPAISGAAHTLLGEQAPLMEQYVAHLADTGVSHGLIGPREVPRLWERHILNCAVVGELLPTGSDLIDIGSGAGLPGLVLAIARPDVQVTLVEPLLRRVTWLEAVTGDLGIDNVRIVRARAEEQWGQLSAASVTSRAVAALDKLARWSLPLVRDGGQMIALKGSSAREELEAVRADLPSWGVAAGDVVLCGENVIDPPTTVTRLFVARHPAPGSLARPALGTAKSSAGGARRGRPGRGRGGSGRHTRSPEHNSPDRKRKH